MKLGEFMQCQSQWTQVGESEGDLVLSSRVRLARNLSGFPFPGWGMSSDHAEAESRIVNRLGDCDFLANGFTLSLDELNDIDRQLLVERHLVSREHAARKANSTVMLSRGLGLSIMINEEDHLRMQSVVSGLDLGTAFDKLKPVDDHLVTGLDIAFDRELGYLTACPTNLGTGLRASVMMHLPGLVLTERMEPVVNGMNKLHVAVRGIYGEGTEALGNLYQVSNQRTLGKSEDQILKHITTLIHQIISTERDARACLLSDYSDRLADQVGRAYGILTHAHLLPTKEAMNWLSLLWLGSDLGMFPKNTRIPDFRTLFETIQPAHLQRAAKEELDPQKRDGHRAETLRRQLKNLPTPDIDRVQ